MRALARVAVRRLWDRFRARRRSPAGTRKPEMSGIAGLEEAAQLLLAVGPRCSQCRIPSETRALQYPATFMPQPRGRLLELPG